MTTPTLERAARLAREADRAGWPYESSDARYFQIARAVLMSVRKPDEAMVADMHLRDPLGCDVEYADDIYPVVWQAGIDAILAEGE